MRWSEINDTLGLGLCSPRALYIVFVFYHVIFVKLHVFSALLLASAQHSNRGKSSLKMRKQCIVESWKRRCNLELELKPVTDTCSFSKMVICKELQGHACAYDISHSFKIALCWEIRRNAFSSLT